MDHHAFGMHHRIIDDIIGDRQERADEDLVAFRALGQPGIAVFGRIGQALGEEAALGAGWHDHGVLHALRFHQAQNLGAEIVAPVGPAQAAAGHRPGAQMDALDTRRIDEDLTPWHRRRQARYRMAVDLEAQRLNAARRKGIGAQHRQRHRAQRAQNPVFIDRRDVQQQLVDLIAGAGRFGVAIPFERGVVTDPEQMDQQPGDRRGARQTVDHSLHGIAHAGLAQIAEPGAQPHHTLRLQRGRDDQAVERIVLHQPVDFRRDRAFDGVGAINQRLGLGGIGHGQQEIMDIGEIAIAQRGRNLTQHDKAEILQHRYGIAEWQRPAQMIDFQPKLVVAIALQAVQAGGAARFPVQRVQSQDIGRGLARIIGAAIGDAEQIGIAQRQGGGALLVDALGQRGFHGRLPAAHHALELGVQAVIVDFGIAVRQVQREAQQGDLPVLQRDRPAQDAAVGAVGQHRFDRAAHRCRYVIARQPDEHEQVTAQRRAHRAQLGARPVRQRHVGQHDLFQIGQWEGDQQIMRQAGERMAQRFAGVA